MKLLVYYLLFGLVLLIPSLYDLICLTSYSFSIGRSSVELSALSDIDFLFTPIPQHPARAAAQQPIKLNHSFC